MIARRTSLFVLLLIGCGEADGGDGLGSMPTTSASTPTQNPSAATGSSATAATPSPTFAAVPSAPPDISMPTPVDTPMPTSSDGTGGAPGAGGMPSTSMPGGGNGPLVGTGGDGLEPGGEGGEPSVEVGGQPGQGGEGNGGQTGGEPETGVGGGEGSGEAGAGGSGEVESPCEVRPLTEEFRQSYDNLDPFYTKYADAGGLPIISSDAPSDMALLRACELVLDMTMRDDIRQALIDNHIRFAIIGNDELTNDIPEYSYLDDSINERARGLGGVPAASCAEESILCDTTRDRWRGEGICVHEFAHTIATGGIFEADPTFEDRLRDAFASARAAGLFENTYAMENFQEYWAEGVQTWYYTNLESDPPNGVHNSIDRREELEEYDPTLHALIAEFLPDPVQFVDCYSDE